MSPSRGRKTLILGSVAKVSLQIICIHPLQYFHFPSPEMWLIRTNSDLVFFGTFQIKVFKAKKKKKVIIKVKVIIIDAFSCFIITYYMKYWVLFGQSQHSVVKCFLNGIQQFLATFLAALVPEVLFLFIFLWGFK